MRKQDRYHSFSELASHEAGEYRIVKIDRGSPVLILAPHGGSLEPGTSEIARTIAADRYNLYCFESLKKEGDRSLHLTSYRFDEPECLRMVCAAEEVIAIHGCEGDRMEIHVGGRNDALGEKIILALKAAGFDARKDNSHHAGLSPQNICNRGRSGRGVQIEMDTAMRRSLFAGLSRNDRSTRTPTFDRFITTIHSALG